MAQQIIFRNGTAAAWTLADPVLAMAEMGVETDTGLFKIGDGVTVWSSLAYGGLVGPQGPAGTDGTDGATGATGPSGATHGNYDGGDASAVYGGVSPLDGGDANDI